jgi:drug/metabolite transporter (DMT)-like permease
VGLISPERQTRRTGAILLLVAGVSLFGVMDGLGKFLAADFPLPQLIWARSAFAIPIILATTAPGGWLTLLRCERPLLQAARGVLPLLASTTVLVGLRFLDLADATAITFAAPLFVVVLSAPILRERVGTTAWIGVGLGFLGVLLVARPGASTIAWAALLPLATAFLFGLYQVLTRLASRSDPPATTLAWTIVTGFVLTTPLLPWGWTNGSLTSWLLLILSGLLFGAGQLLLIRAFAAAPAAILTPLT